MSPSENPPLSLKEFTEGFKNFLSQKVLPEPSEIINWITENLPETIKEGELRGLRQAIRCGLIEFAEYSENVADSWLRSLNQSHFKEMLEAGKHEDYASNPPEVVAKDTSKEVDNKVDKFKDDWRG